jgi:adenylate kinase
MELLPPGHPSSPYDDTGSPREPERTAVASAEGRDEPGADRLPFTDADWREHTEVVRDRLDEAERAGLATDRRHTIDPDGLIWSAERDSIHDTLVDELYAECAAVPCEHKAIIAGGLPGAGKTTILGAYAGIDRSQYLTINPDNVKEEMAKRGLIPEVTGLSPMEASDLVHEEASHIAKRLADRARVDGKNIIWDITMSSTASVQRRISDLRSDNYTSVDGLFVHIPIDISTRRADNRHREDEEKFRAGNGLGGRFIPNDVIATQFDEAWGSVNRRTFEELKQDFDHWAMYDNSVDGGRPALVDESDL